MLTLTELLINATVRIECTNQQGASTALRRDLPVAGFGFQWSNPI
jgi:hypothetical protein